ARGRILSRGRLRVDTTKALLTNPPFSALPPSGRLGWFAQAQRGQQACPGIFYRNGARVQRVAPAWRRLQTDLGDGCGRKVLRPRLPRGRCSAPARTAAPGPPGLLAARIAPIASGPSTVAISRSRPPPRGQASTSTAIARRISAAHAQWRTADLDESVA